MPSSEHERPAALGEALDIASLVKRLPPQTRHLILLDERDRLRAELLNVEKILKEGGWDEHDDS